MPLGYWLSDRRGMVCGEVWKLEATWQATHPFFQGEAVTDTKREGTAMKLQNATRTPIESIHLVYSYYLPCDDITRTKVYS